MTCLDGSNMRSQGRDEAYIAVRIRQKMINKGCTSDAKQPVFRLKDGKKIFRCPRALCDESDSLAAFSEYSSLTNGIYSYQKKEVTWKWARSMQAVKSELASSQKQRMRDSNSKN